MERGRRSGDATLQRTWARVRTQLRAQPVPPPLADLLERIRPIAATPSELRLEAPSRGVLQSLLEEALPVLRDAVATVMGPRQIRLELPQRAQGELFAEGPESLKPGVPVVGTLKPRFTFDTYVVGASNQFAHAACRAVAGQPGEHYNPLFLYGGTGLGKTHLLHAIAHHVLRDRPESRVAYLSSDAFMGELVASLRRDRMDDFKKRFRQIDLLLVDDVQLLAGRERTQEEFFHTFNTLHEARKQIVLTSDTVPKEIPELEERLRSRFEWGLIADIQSPDVETRVAILQRKAELDGIPLPVATAVFLAEQVSSNVRELEGILTRLTAQASLGGGDLSVDYAREALQQTGRGRARAITFDEITTAVCDHFSIRPTELHSRRRSRHVAMPRQVAMYLCRRHLRESFPTIGEFFGRDHSTVMHAVSVTERRLKDDEGLREVLDLLERRLREA